MPRGLHTEQLAQRDELARRGQPPDRGHVYAQQIHAAAGDQPSRVGHRGDLLADREWHRHCGPDLGQPIVELQRDRVLQEEQPVRLQLAGHPDRLLHGEPVMHVVQEVRLLAEHLTRLREQLRRDAQVVLHVPAVRVRRAGKAPVGPPAPVRAPAARTDLQPYVPVAVGQDLRRLGDRFVDRGAAGMQVNRGAAAYPAAEQLVDRHVRTLAGDVPERLVDAGQRTVEHRAAAPVRAEVDHPGDVLDVGRMPADDQRCDVLVHGRDDRAETLGEGGAAESTQSGLIRVDPHDDDRQAFGCGHDRAYAR